MNESFVKRVLITQATSAKRSKLDKGFIVNGSIWDKLVLKKIQNLLGGRIHTWVSTYVGVGVVETEIDYVGLWSCATGSESSRVSSGDIWLHDHGVVRVDRVLRFRQCHQFRQFSAGRWLCRTTTAVE